MKIRSLVAGAAAAGLLFGLAPRPAQAADAATVVFTAGATISKPLYAPGLGPAQTGVTFNFSTTLPGIGGQGGCVGAHSSRGADAQCGLAANGTFGPGVGNVGAYCGFSHGVGTVTLADVNGSVIPAGGMSLEWPQSAGTVLPLVYRSGGNVVGAGAVQTTGAQPGTCGVGGPTTSFAVTGFSSFATP